MLDEPDAIVKKFKRRADRLRRARSCARDDKPGISNLIEILAIVARHRAGGGRARVRRLAATATSRPPSATAVAEWLAPGARALPASCARTTTALEGILEAGADEGAGDRRARRVADVREAMGVGPVRSPSAAA